MPIKYTVKPGDTLYRIAKEQLGDQKKAKDIARMNDLPDMNYIKVGQILLLPLKAVVVTAGDTLPKIAKEHLGDEDKWKDIAVHNKLDNLCFLPKGRLLFLPEKQYSVWEQEEDDYITDKYRIYITGKDDTLDSIALDQLGNASKAKKIAEMNALGFVTTDPLPAGKKIRIPRDEEEIKDEKLINQLLKEINEKFTDLNKDDPRIKLIKKWGENPVKAMDVFIGILLNIDWVEGCFAYMYPDAKGLVTVGLGYNVDNINQVIDSKDSPLLPFCVCDHKYKGRYCPETKHSKATVEQIRAAHHLGKKKSTVDKKIILEKEEIIKTAYHLLDNVYLEDIKKVVGGSGLSNLPVPILVALLDVFYNIGFTKLNKPAKEGGFPKYLKAVKEQDWETACKEGKRKQKTGEDGIRKRNILDQLLYHQGIKLLNANKTA